MSKTIAVVGVTGIQGSSVAKVFLNEPGWTVRGITRDPSKPSATKWADQGVKLVAADLDDVESLKKAFKGANVIYGITDFWQHFLNPASHQLAAEQNRTPNEVAYDLELAQAKSIIDAAAANVATLDRFVFSTLSDAQKWSKGTIKWNKHFDSKAAGVDYLKATYPKLWAKTSLLNVGLYDTNWKQGIGAPQKQKDGSFVISVPIDGDAKMPFVDTLADTGAFVKALVEVAPGKTLAGTGSYTTYNDFSAIFGKVHNVTCVFKKLPRETLEAAVGLAFANEIEDMFDYIEKFDYNGGDPDVVYPWDLGVDVKYTSLEEYIKKEDWTSVL